MEYNAPVQRDKTESDILIKAISGSKCKSLGESDSTIAGLGLSVRACSEAAAGDARASYLV
jgi:hypothetical protein